MCLLNLRKVMVIGGNHYLKDMETAFMPVTC